MPDRRGSEPARYEDRLRARHWMSMTLANQEPRRFVAVSEEERDALAAAVEALREVLNTEGSEIPHNTAVRALAALAALADGEASGREGEAA